MSVTASMNGDGLGMLSWWALDEGGEEGADDGDGGGAGEAAGGMAA